MKKKSIRFVVFRVLLSVFILANGQPSHADDSDYETTPNADGTITITKYTGSSQNVTIPDELDGEIVTWIGNNAFRGQGSPRLRFQNL